MTPDSDLTPATAARLMDELTAVVARASAVILAAAASGRSHRTKPDGSPVTAADEASEAVILDALVRLLPGVPVVSEEMAGKERPPALGRSFILVDPLDGTREFIAGRDEFTVNLAIVSQGAPIAGIVAAPMRGLLWRGVSTAGAERLQLARDGGVGAPQAIRARARPQRGAIALASRSHLDPATKRFLEQLPEARCEYLGSAIKFCKIAEGEADVYPRLAPTCEWDVAAGHAVLAAAGGAVTAADGAALAYGRAAQKFIVPAFIAWGDPRHTPTIGR